MNKNQKTKRTQIKDLAVNEQELSGKEMENVQGGMQVAQNPRPGAVAPPLPPTGTTIKAAPEPKKELK